MLHLLKIPPLISEVDDMHMIQIGKTMPVLPLDHKHVPGLDLKRLSIDDLFPLAIQNADQLFKIMAVIRHMADGQHPAVNMKSSDPVIRSM